MTFNCSKNVVTVVIAHFLCSVDTLKCHEYCIKISRRDSKTWSQIVHLVRNSTPKRFSGFEARILRIGHFFGWEWKFFKVSSWRFKHPIKIIFCILDLQHVFPTKNSMSKKMTKWITSFVQITLGIVQKPRGRGVDTKILERRDGCIDRGI